MDRAYTPYDPVGKPTIPYYRSWDEYLAWEPYSDIKTMCAKKAYLANRKRLASPQPDIKLKAVGVLAILVLAEGRCFHCNSLCVERMPVRDDGRLAPWGHVGRRLGSLGHIVARIEGGDNDLANLQWECMWCNTWPTERRWNATDHGGLST